MQKSGGELAQKFGLSNDTSKVKVVADFNSQRDVDSALALAHGLGLQRTSIQSRSALFSSVKSKVCPETDPGLTLKERTDRFAAVPMPWNLTDAIDELYEIIGVGPQGKFPRGSTAGELDSNGKPTGALSYLKLFGQLMLYANASDVSYANATREQLNKFIAWQHYYRSISDYTTEKLVDQASGVLSAALEDLTNGEFSANIYAGHDDTLDGIAVALNLTWNAPPYMGGDLLPTLPGGALHFEHDHETGYLNVSYVYHEFHDTGPFSLKSTSAASFSNMDAFAQALRKGLKARPGAWECFQKFHVPEAFESTTVLV